MKSNSYPNRYAFQSILEVTGIPSRYRCPLKTMSRVIVCDRRGAPRQGNKGDQVDADQLSELLRRGALRAVYHGSADRATLKELTRTYRNLVEDATGHYVDVDIYGTYNVTNRVGVQVGFRSFDLGYLVKEDTGSFTLKGVFFGVVARY